MYDLYLYLINDVNWYHLRAILAHFVCSENEANNILKSSSFIRSFVGVNLGWVNCIPWLNGPLLPVI